MKLVKNYKFWDGCGVPLAPCPLLCPLHSSIMSENMSINQHDVAVYLVCLEKACTAIPYRFSIPYTLYISVPIYSLLSIYNYKNIRYTGYTEGYRRSRSEDNACPISTRLKAHKRGTGYATVFLRKSASSAESVDSKFSRAMTPQKG